MWTPISNRDNMIADMFKIALALEEPWKLTHIEYDDKDEAWHLFLDFERGALFACPRVAHRAKRMMLRRKTGVIWTFGTGRPTFMPVCRERTARTVRK